MIDVLCAGEALWDSTTPAGTSFADARSLLLRPGGAAVNVALALAKMRLSAGLAAVVGDDALGQGLVARIAGRGVDTSLVTSAPPRTGLVLVERGDAGRRIVGYRAADEPAPRAGGAWQARVLLMSGLRPDEEQAASFAEAIARAREIGAWIAVDVNARRRIWKGREAQHAARTIAAAHVVKCSVEDLGVLGSSPEAVRSAMQSDAVLVITDGPRAARALGAFGELARSPRSLPPVDPMGAGDAFMAALVAELTGTALPDLGRRDLWERVLERGHALARDHLKRAA